MNEYNSLFSSFVRPTVFWLVLHNSKLIFNSILWSLKYIIQRHHLSLEVYILAFNFNFIFMSNKVHNCKYWIAR